MAVLLLGTSLLGVPQPIAQTLAAKTEAPSTMRFKGAPFEITAAHRNLTYIPVTTGLREKPREKQEEDDLAWCHDQIASFGTLASTECHANGDCRTTTTPMTCGSRITEDDDPAVVCTEFLKGVCPKACNSCLCVDQENTGWVDSEHNPVKCPQLHSWGYCETALKSTPLTCAKTCGYCQPGAGHDIGPQSPPPPPSVPEPMSPPPPPAMPPCDPTGPCVHKDPDYVGMHNAKRHLHKNTPDLIYDEELAAQAQAYAELCPTGHNQHGVDLQALGQGENLHWAWTSAIHGPEVHYQDAINDWYEEIKDYKWPTDYGDFHTDGEIVGHFTQLVWQATYKVGCGAYTREVDQDGNDIPGKEGCSNLVTGRGGRSNVIVCRYSNAGNFKNNYADPPIGYYNNVGACSWGFKDHDEHNEPVCADPPDDTSEIERSAQAAEGAAGHHHGEDDDEEDHEDAGKQGA